MGPLVANCARATSCLIGASTVVILRSIARCERDDCSIRHRGRSAVANGFGLYRDSLGRALAFDPQIAGFGSN